MSPPTQLCNKDTMRNLWDMLDFLKYRMPQSSYILIKNWLENEPVVSKTRADFISQYLCNILCLTMSDFFTKYS